MKRSSARSSRSPLLVWVCVVLVPLIGIYLMYLSIGSLFLPKTRTTILLLTDPVEVASFDPEESQWSFVSFPVSTHIAGIQGLGEYAIDSLWSIAATEGSPSAVVLGSLTDELGVSIDYFLGDIEDQWKVTGEQSAKKYLSLSGVIRAFFRGFNTNIPFPLFVSLTKSLRGTEINSQRALILAQNAGLVEKELPDHSKILVFNRDQFDSMSDDIFEDASIRKERLRIAIFNTTGRPFLGSRVARIMNKIGGNVIQIGNDSTEVDQCQLEGSTDHLTTKTAQTIQQLFACFPKEVEEGGRADLTIRIGRVYEQRYLPKE